MFGADETSIGDTGITLVTFFNCNHPNPYPVSWRALRDQVRNNYSKVDFNEYRTYLGWLLTVYAEIGTQEGYLVILRGFT